MKVKCVCKKMWWDLWWHSELIIIIFIAITLAVVLTVCLYMFPLQSTIVCGIGILIFILWLIYKFFMYVRDVIRWCDK